MDQKLDQKGQPLKTVVTTYEAEKPLTTDGWERHWIQINAKEKKTFFFVVYPDNSI